MVEVVRYSNIFCFLSHLAKKKYILVLFRKRLTPQAVKIRADIEVSCFAYDGIDAVKEALIKGQKCSTQEMPIKVIEEIFLKNLVLLISGSSGCFGTCFISVSLLFAD